MWVAEPRDPEEHRDARSIPIDRERRRRVPRPVGVGTRARRWRSPRPPVRAVAPEENAFRIANMPTAAAVVAVPADQIRADLDTADNHRGSRADARSPRGTGSRSMNPYVGTANTVPDSCRRRAGSRTSRAERRADGELDPMARSAHANADPDREHARDHRHHDGHHVVEAAGPRPRRAGERTRGSPCSRCTRRRRRGTRARSAGTT